jgi:hypothetical protein
VGEIGFLERGPRLDDAYPGGLRRSRQRAADPSDARADELLTQATLAPVFEGWYPNLQTHVCPSGHYPMQETPVEYAHVVQKYLAATAAA